ncbi:hypothetical protein QQP08_003317 [Theobroma cacao]|nr:hypothetical protein QQP08_003317 [Theobroma cacao]
MALWMERGSEPKTESEIADLEAISALKESAALELKEKGNEFVKKGKKHYQEAIDCYSRAINQKVLNDQDTSVLFSNKAHVNLLLGNYRRAVTDAQDAIKLSPANVKAYYRAAKACLSLNLLSEAKSYCESGIGKDPSNEELKKLAKQIDLKKMVQEQREAQVSKALVQAKDLVSAIEGRSLKIGKAMYRELTGLRKPELDKNGILHWPVLLLYAEVMSSDFIEDFCETEMFSAHLDIISFLFSLLNIKMLIGFTIYFVIFSVFYALSKVLNSQTCFQKVVPLYRGIKKTIIPVKLLNFTMSTYMAGSGVYLSKTKIIHHLLEGTAASNVESVGEEEKDAVDCSTYGDSAGGSSKWVKVNEKGTLHDVLKEPNFIIPMIPVFYVVSKRSCFYKDFRAGKWAPPM